MQVALRNKEDLLLEKALERIRRAQILGKRNVKLSQPEIDALERKRRQDEVQPTRVDKKNDRRKSSGMASPTGRALKPKKRRSGGLSPSYDTEYALAEKPLAPPGMVIPRSDGRTSYAPFGYYQPGASNSDEWPSRSGSGQGSRNSRRSTPPLPPSQHRAHVSRHNSGSEYIPPSPTGRVSPMPRRLPDDPNWNPRSRSTSSSQPHQLDPYQYQAYSPPLPQMPNQYLQGRRIVSGPPDVQYPNDRRSTLAQSSHAALSEPSHSQRRHPRNTYSEDTLSDGDTDEDDDDYGVQVNVVSHNHGYEVRGPSTATRQRRTQR